MTSDAVKAAIQATPFRPFRLHLASGRSWFVPHPEFIAYAGGRIAVVMTADDVGEHVDLLLVEGIAFEVQTASA